MDADFAAFQDCFMGMDKQTKQRRLKDVAAIAGSYEVMRSNIMTGICNMKLFLYFEHLFKYAIDCIKAGIIIDTATMNNMKLLAAHWDSICDIISAASSLYLKDEASD